MAKSKGEDGPERDEDRRANSSRNGSQDLPGEAAPDATRHPRSTSGASDAASTSDMAKRKSNERAAANELQDATAGLSQQAQAQIGRRLRAMYDEVAKAPVPEKFLTLLDTLSKQQKQR